MGIFLLLKLSTRVRNYMEMPICADFSLKFVGSASISQFFYLFPVKKMQQYCKNHIQLISTETFRPRILEKINKQFYL